MMMIMMMMMSCAQTCSDRRTASHLRPVWLLSDGAPVATVTGATHLEELSDQLTELAGVAVGHWLVAPPADPTDQLLQTAGLKLQVIAGEFLPPQHTTTHFKSFHHMTTEDSRK